MKEHVTRWNYVRHWGCNLMKLRAAALKFVFFFTPDLKKIFLINSFVQSIKGKTKTKIAKTNCLHLVKPLTKCKPLTSMM